MPAYVIGEVTVTDGSWAAEYSERIQPLLEKHGGKYIGRAAPAEKLEGDRSLSSVVVMLEFPSADQARSWYVDPDYAPLIDLRNTGSSAEIMLVDGV